MSDEDFPRRGENVVGTVDRIVDYGAFIKLDEYGGKEALCHISEVASGWVKHIKDHVQEGQKVVAKVLEVNPSKGHINVSIKDINEHQRREKIREWRSERKAEAWLDLAAKEIGRDKSEVKSSLKEEFKGLYPAFEEAALKGSGVLKGVVGDEWASIIVEIAEENVEIPEVEIEGYLEIQSYSPDGVRDIRKALKEAESTEIDREEKLSVTYVGSPEYRINVSAPDYKSAEKILKEAAERAVKTIEERGGTGSFRRERR